MLQVQSVVLGNKNSALRASLATLRIRIKDITAAFQRHFGMDNALEELKDKVDDRKQHTSESPVEYANDINEMCKLIHSKVEEIIRLVNRGLTDSYQKLYVMFPVKVETLTDLRDVLKHCEKYRELEDSKRERPDLYPVYAMEALAINANPPAALEPPRPPAPAPGRRPHFERMTRTTDEIAMFLLSIVVRDASVFFFLRIFTQIVR